MGRTADSTDSEIMIDPDRQAVSAGQATRTVELNGSRVTMHRIGNEWENARVAPSSDRALEQAVAFKYLPREQALEKYPTLSPAYAALDAVTMKSHEQHLDKTGEQTALTHARARIAQLIERGELPQMRQHKQVELVRAQDHDRGRDR
jgi:hypothetical protein